ncbi:RNA polymerase sigma factor [Tenacibaculum singaporense]|uniref:RNA polymerase sigma factor n=1 Tax=Tenacibaculum singaporense TaxID=2358479 RepID=UPI000F677091|nr:RNA polymerase sigma factor [Tenacibaculum singaporense]RSC92938.1 RNA polymerase sigma factor [Tenacibaculum singaporense]
MNNKEQNFEQLYKGLKDKIYRLCLGFMGNTDDADDLFQEVLIKIWNNIDNFREESSINTWVYRITTNTALFSLNKIKKSRKNHTNLIPKNLITENNQEHLFCEQDKVSKLYQAISSLKEIDRIIISLLLEDNSYKEIADITGINISNVGVRINRIKKILLKKI